MSDTDRELQAMIAGVVETLRHMNATPGIDPIVLARRAHVDELDAMAALGQLILDGRGKFAVQVLNGLGQPVREFPSLDQTPEKVIDDYGNEIDVDTENTRIVFRPAATFFASVA